MDWEKAGRILATIGLIILLILGAWGIIILAFNAPDFFSNLRSNFSGLWGSSTTTPSGVGTTTPSSVPETMAVAAASSTVTAGDAITVSWSNNNAAGARGYLVSYACQTGLTLDAPLPDHTYRKVPCNTNFNYTNAQSSIDLRTHLSAAVAEPAIITVSAISLATGSTTATGSATVTVRPASASASVGKSSPAPAYPKSTKVTSYMTPAPKGYAYNPYGTPDLAVRIVSVGAGWVQFNIQNVGTKTVLPGWQFTVSVPAIDGTTAPYTYTSTPEIALAPRSGIVFTLRWSLPIMQPITPCQYQPYPYDAYSNNSTYGWPQQNCPQNNCYQTQTFPYPSYGGPAQNCLPQYQYNAYNSYPARTITIAADPYGQVPDANRYNNTAVANF